MKIKIWKGPDYRETRHVFCEEACWHPYGACGSSKRTFELNFMFGRWSLRVLLPRLGVSVWRDYEQTWRLNYPSLRAEA